MTSHPAGPVAAAILAGGQARRLGGANKAALSIGGVRIIDRQLALLRQLADPVFIVSGHPGRFDDLALEVVRDALPGRGALGAVYTALLTSPHPRALILACDMPFVTLSFLERLVQPSTADLVIPRSSRGYEPLCATWTSACIPAVRRRLDRGELQAARAVEDLRVEEIGPEALARWDPHGRLFVNVNTPPDYERAIRLADHA